MSAALTNSTPVAEAQRPATAPAGAERPTSFVEMSDEELMGWLTSSVLEEDSERGRAPSPDTQDFWDRVASTEAAMAALGFEGPVALDRAIGLVGLDASLRADGERAPADPSDVAAWETAGNTAGEYELLRLHTELVEAASRAVASWATLQGSALRAANQSKG